jgi:heptose-I-phosphate ethanolaminephosphotransferase
MQNYRDAEKRDSYEVPFLFWFSPEYRAAYPDRIAAAEAAVDKPIQMDRVAEGILSVFGIASKDYPASENFLSQDFAIKPRYLMEGRILYREDASSVR